MAVRKGGISTGSVREEGPPDVFSLIFDSTLGTGCLVLLTTSQGIFPVGKLLQYLRVLSMTSSLYQIELRGLRALSF